MPKSRLPIDYPLIFSVKGPCLVVSAPEFGCHVSAGRLDAIPLSPDEIGKAVFRCWSSIRGALELLEREGLAVPRPQDYSRAPPGRRKRRRKRPPIRSSAQQQTNQDHQEENV